ncbi:hypothetical protein GLOTRDRAFT_132411 [Gloeophyllum trabeum ATCC 11539]|uniref:Concanavalin A-like lectin/glucanase n=1 Tax=Gloeophyllum trabeum (strain ATCC 11539 / FP-39264 / Madison 617) TaxID=670483 RepID=S7PXQ2_GLOTA|nr:uncharacterized protein GLOTRDRAFT_132411 [Gloeophyllum trabeum ATCC 11539]EPQ52293.1 hypothetical protein GLOTRDRAFT_132411 [Gloeophyllum trabeum ATCC 11539]
MKTSTRVLLAIYALCNLSGTLSALVNTTIDDTYGDPLTGAQVSYAPESAWNAEGPGTTCAGCTAHPAQASMYDLTWHDGTFSVTPGSDNDTGSILSLSVPFNGSVLYVFCALTFTYDHPAGNSDMQFFIDGARVGAFELAPNGSTAYTYQYPVYVNESIPVGQHVFSLESGHAGNKSLVIFDYLVYSHEENLSEVSTLAPLSTSPQSPTSPTSPAESPAATSAGSWSAAAPKIKAGAFTGGALPILFLSAGWTIWEESRMYWYT